MKTVMDAVNEFGCRFPSLRYTTDGWYEDGCDLFYREQTICSAIQFNDLVSQLEHNFNTINYSYADYKKSFSELSDMGVIGSKAKEDHPVFTQAMADNGELPVVGSYFIDIEYNTDKPVLAIAHDLPMKRVVYKSCDNDPEYFGAVAHECKPIDTRTDKEKLFDAINSVPRIYIDDANKLVDDIISGKLTGVKWVGE